MRTRSSAFLFILVSLFSCGKKSEPTLFELLPAEKTGISFENKLTSTAELNILEYLYFYNGGGVAAGDINNDGLVDLYFTGNQVPNKLYLNKGNFKFEDITKSAGVDGGGGWSTGVTMADVNGDGLLDIYVSQVGNYKTIQGKNKLYINQGDQKFVDLADEYGVGFVGFSTHAAFFDYDRDGDLDMYLLNHSVKSPEVFAKAENRSQSDPGGDKLFKNLAVEGERGFLDVTQESGIYSSVLGFGLGVGVEDLNGDGWLDIYVSNDFTENDYLYLNQQDGTFKESLESLISNTSRYSMGNDLADINGDGLSEIFTTDMLPEDPEIWMKSVGEDKTEVYQIKKQFGYADQYVRNHLQLNQGKEGFSDIALFSGVFASDWSWSPLIFDMDNDGLADIHITNGIVKRPNDLDFIQYSQEADPNLTMEELRKRQIDMLPSVKLPNPAYRNEGDLTFTNQAQNWGLDQASYSNGSTYADLDNDGDLDLVINNLDQISFVYQNHSEKSGNVFLRANLEGKALNPFGLGSKVTVYSGEKSWSQRLSTSRGFQSGTSTTLVFGLGKTSEIDSVLVNWSNGDSEVFSEIQINQTSIFKQATGKTFLSPPSTPEDSIAFPQIDWNHVEKDELDETKREYLIPRSFSQMGPALAVGDVNADGLDDVYLGGAKDQAGALFLQIPDGTFMEATNPIFQQLAKAEDVVAEFADFNGDGKLDLYVGSGGNEFESGNLFLFDRIYFGDGKGGFQFITMALPPIGENTSTLAIHDIDGDGDLDIFTGAAVVPGDYGANPKSTLLVNQGNGQFKDGTEAWFGIGAKLGMINSAVWEDLDGDQKAELILTGDWQPIRVYELSQDNKLVEKTIPGLENSTGWIQSLLIEDLNGDGKKDIVAGNLGLNSKLKASAEKPVWLYHHDFDGNGQADPLIFHYMGEKLVPLATRDDLIKQIPAVKRKHTSYLEYASIYSPEDLFQKEILDQAHKKSITEFRSGVYFRQEDGSFAFTPFPSTAQLSPIQSMNWDEDSKTIWLGGNFSGFRVDLGKSTASAFSAWKWKNEGFEQVRTSTSIPSLSEVRNLRSISVYGKKWGIATTNNGRIYWISKP
ncbi:MAG: VCBS repeat-containing protein [Algoriphagus sp.]|nr:VCBS repeat-containing protein [Algoriphagus sp.]